MRFYAQLPGRAVRQAIGDVLLLAWVVGWIAIGNALHDLVDRLAAPGRSVEQAGNRLARSMRDVEDRVGVVPGAGGALRRPFRGARDAGTALADAGRTQQETIHQLAFWLAVIVAGIPIAWALLHRLPRRVGWMREVAAAERLSGDLDLFAFRALASRPLAELSAVGRSPAADWLRRDSGAVEALARLEFERLGLRGRTRAVDENPTGGAPQR